MSNHNHHLGAGFRVWNAQQTWFWLVANPYRSGGVIGTAATEAQAIREACWTIEETLASCEAISASREERITLAVWKRSLENLARCLTSVGEAAA